MKEVILSWVTPILDDLTQRVPSHVVTHINVDSFSSMVTIVLEKGRGVKTIQMTMNKAREINFINLNALKDFVK